MSSQTSSSPPSSGGLRKRVFDKLPGKSIFGRDPASEKLCYEFQNDWELIPSLEKMERGEYTMSEAVATASKTEEESFDGMLLVR